MYVEVHIAGREVNRYTTAFAIPVASSPRIVAPFLFFKTFSMKASPALYELRTRGPLAQYKKPISKALCRHSSNVAGVTYSSTFIWRLVGRIYWPKVTTSTSTFRSSKRISNILGISRIKHTFQCIPELFLLFSQSEHQACLCDQSWDSLLRLL